MDFEILSINEATGEMVIDWGWVTLNHPIPLAILENPDMSQADMIMEISFMKPERPSPTAVPEGLKQLVKTDVAETPGGEGETFV